MIVKSVELKIMLGLALIVTYRPVPSIGVNVGPVYVAAMKFPLTSIIYMLRLDVVLV